MTFAIHSSDGKGFGAGMADYPPPFKPLLLLIYDHPEVLCRGCGSRPPDFEPWHWKYCVRDKA